MKTWHVQCARLFAAGLMSAALAVPAAAAVFVNPVLKDVQGRPTGGVEIPSIRVTSRVDLVTRLQSEFKGRVIVAADIDLSGLRNIPLKSGVSLIGERGRLGSRPRLSTLTTSFSGGIGTKVGYNLFKVAGNGVRVQGIHFQGPANTNKSRSDSQLPVSAIQVVQNKAAKPEEQSGLSVIILDNEFNEWTNSGVDVTSEHLADTPREYDAKGWPRISKEDAVRVERNYFHHNARDGLGYGVVVGGGAYAVIEGNVFDFNRHAVAASGRAYSGYIARYNYVLQGGYTQDGKLDINFYNQHFDVHGRGNDGYGGLAGEYFEIVHNTIRGAQKYHRGFSTRPALMLRGMPADRLLFNGNVLVHDNHDEATSFKGTDFQVLVREGKYQAGGNRFDTDYSKELATGDFDGDSRTDVFVATGTAWFFSRGGIRPWEFLHGSNKRTQDLGFADIDNDGKTDVLYRDSVGNVGYLKSGTGGLVPLTQGVPVLMKDLRFGDFDGDGKTDIFFTHGFQWHLWYGRTGRWITTQSSSLPVTEMLFGEFDDVRGTDLVGTLVGDWVYSSGAAKGWEPLGERRTKSLANAVAADFDGNGRSDIAVNDGGKWSWSRDGVAPLFLLRDGEADTVGFRNASLKSMLVGRFDGGARAQVVRFNYSPFDLLGAHEPEQRLWIWRGLGSSNTFSPLSERNMR